MTGGLRAVPGFRTTWTASTVSAFGSYVTTFAVGVLVVDGLGGSAADVGIVRAAGWLPYLLFGLVVGAIVDQLRRKPLLIATDVVRGLLLCLVPVLWLTGHLSVPWLASLVAVVGLAALVGDAAFQSFAPRLVPGRLLTAAHARFDQSDAVAQASGPALAGALVTAIGAPFAVLVDAFSFLVAAALLTRVRVDEPAGRLGSVRRLPAQVREGVSWVYGHPMLRPMALGNHGWFLFSGAAQAVLTPFALRTLGLSPLILGLALSTAGVGAVIGSSVAVRLGARLGTGRLEVATQVCAAVAWVLVALSAGSGPELALLFAGQLLIGLDIGMSSNTMGYRQLITPDRLQARMNAGIRSVNRAAIVIGAPLGGLLGDFVGYRPMMLGAACGFGLVALAVSRSAFWGARLGDHHTLAQADRVGEG